MNGELARMFFLLPAYPGTGKQNEPIMKTMKQWIVWPALVAALVLGPGCKEDTSAEKAGKELDKAATATKDGLKKAADKTGDAIKDAGNKVKDATK